MPKILKPYTIIPQELYVQRDADRQIRNIINDMGRPGYVLVSRQMGKTNLLLNAKRNLESSEDVFVYIDLSNPFDSPKSCFENIIDTAIETNLDKLLSLKRVIAEARRANSELPPHKLHTNELRLILKSISGKLVIILDEIDALTKTNYSDQIFAQIRSIYFSRVNYLELEKLTYILSGVVEPTELIKDPKISPFNIGQKIFLNDFNKIEFDSFLKKSNLNLEIDVVERIFYWTNGNPRMTWDICSEVENLNKKSDINSLSIDKLVKELYLTNYDKPPIDNIREIVKNDREIRNAVVEIEYGKGSFIPDRIKRKLYLSGIINFDENDLKIKNQIIKECLNLDWIESIEEDEKGLIGVGIDYFEKEKYDDALNVFERYLLNNTFNNSDKSLCYYYMAYAAYKLKFYLKAINYLDNVNFDREEEPKWYYLVLNLKGLAFFFNKQYEESIISLKEVIKTNRNDETFLKALYNYGLIVVKSNNIKEIENSIIIFNDIVNETNLNREKTTTETINELKAISYYSLAIINKFQNKLEESELLFNKSYTFSKTTAKPSIVLELLKISVNEVNLNHLKEVVELILNKELIPSEPDNEKPFDFSLDILKSILIYNIEYNKINFNKLIDYYESIEKKEKNELLFELALFSINKKTEVKITLNIIEEILINTLDKEEFLSGVKNKALKLYFSLTPIEVLNEFNVIYVELLERYSFDEFELFDIKNFANYIYFLTERKELEEALFIISILNKFKPYIGEDLLGDFLIIEYLELKIYIDTFRIRDCKIKANGILSSYEKIKINKIVFNYIDDESLKYIIELALKYSKPLIKSTINLNQIYKRNDYVKVKYKDGRIVEKKYKLLEYDLKIGDCVLINQ